MTAPVPSEEDPDPVVSRTAAYVTRQAEIRERIAVNVMAGLGRVFDGLETPAGAERVVPDLVHQIQAGQRATAQTSGAYVAGLLDGAPDADRAAVSIELPASMRAAGQADPTTPYRRPFVQWSRDLGKGVDPDEARLRARQRLMVMADSDLTTAMREGVRQTVADHPDVIGMRRVIHPELSRGGVCGLCVAASDRLYSKRILMPIHARCVCEPVIVTRSHDPGLQLNEADWAAIYGPETVTEAAGLKSTRWAVDYHGEYGPVLRRADDAFEAPDPRARAIELAHHDADRQAASVTPIGLARDPRQLSREELSEAMQDAISRDDWDRFDELSEEDQRRDAERERSRERSRVRDEQRAAEMERRLAEGQDEETAVADVYGVSVDKQRRDRAMALLRSQGYVGAGFDELSREAYKYQAHHAYLDAETATRGHMLSREGQAAGIDPRALFTGPESRARRWASDELLQWWDDNGRPSLEEYRAELLGAGAAAAASRAERGSYLQ